MRSSVVTINGPCRVKDAPSSMPVSSSDPASQYRSAGSVGCQIPETSTSISDPDPDRLRTETTSPTRSPSRSAAATDTVASSGWRSGLGHAPLTSVA